MLLWWFGGLAAVLAALGLVAWRVVQRHRVQASALVVLGAGLGSQRLEGALRQLARQRGSFRRVYLWDESPSASRQQMLRLLSRELGFYLPTRAELASLREQLGCRLFYLDAFGRLHKQNQI